MNPKYIDDLTIAVREKVDVEGFSAWTIKAGILHVQPPVSILNNMLTLRVHLDHADENNGALRVLPGTFLAHPRIFRVMFCESAPL